MGKAKGANGGFGELAVDLSDGETGGGTEPREGGSTIG